MRINRFLARAGLASRRKADELVLAKRVCINGKVIDQVGASINLDADIVTVDGRQIELPEEQTLLLHKPAGYLVSRRAQGGRPTIFSILPAEFSSVQPVGRLDIDTDGVLLLTNDGELSRRLQHPRYQIERVYRAVVTRAPGAGKIRQIKAGIDLGERTPARAEIRIRTHRASHTVVEVRMREGRKHEVKRLLAWADSPVITLTRLSFAGLEVGKLAPGAYRKLRSQEIAALRRLTGLAN